jgi:hypothetical protein
MKEFFDSVRADFGSLSTKQVEGIEVLFAACNGLPAMHAAYILATAWHETARTMQPIYERGSVAYFNKYDAGTPIGKRLGNTLKGDGFKFRGRGYVQITGRTNYLRASNANGVDLVGAPDRALEPAIAAKIIVDGMCRGWFTGKKLANYDNFTAMRRVVNGTDKAALIAGYATKFQTALAKAPQPLPDTPVVAGGKTDIAMTPPAATGLLARFRALFGITAGRA